jgi:hypothetical protein
MKPLITLLALSLSLAQAAPADLGSVKNYLLERLVTQKVHTQALVSAANRYYDIANTAGFDYGKIAAGSAPAIRSALTEARLAWQKASPVYESVEGIVAGVELLADYDLNLDAGASKAEGGEAIVGFDLKLSNGKTLEKPGNIFGVSESALWGTFKDFSSGVRFDVDGDGKIGFGDHLPEANVLRAAAEKLDALTGELITTAKTWQPTQQDVFGALAANVPTAAPVFLDRWKTSRFVLGDKSTKRDFVVISSLSDLVGNIASWQKLYGGVASLVQSKNAALDKQISEGLSGLKGWTEKLLSQEAKRRFNPEQAELIYKEGDNRATAITGKIVQAAALLGVKVEQ